MSITYPPDVKRHVISSIELRSRKDRMYNILVERVRKCHEVIRLRACSMPYDNNFCTGIFGNLWAYEA